MHQTCCWFSYGCLLILSQNAPIASSKDWIPLCATDEDVVDRDVYQLNNVSDHAHDQEAHADGLRDTQELSLVRLAASRDELPAVLDELAGHLQ